MSEEIVEPDDVWRRINWPGIIAGVLMVTVPFQGAWWRFMLGTEALIMAISPFGVELRIFGETLSSPLFSWLCLGFKLGVVYLGVLLLAGSAFSGFPRHAALAEFFVRFSARKLVWLVVAFVASLLGFCVFANRLPELAGLPLQSQLPYLSGRSTISAGAEGLSLSVPIFMGFTQAFALAVVAAALGIVAWQYQKRLL